MFTYYSILLGDFDFIIIHNSLTFFTGIRFITLWLFEGKDHIKLKTNYWEYYKQQMAEEL